MKYWITKASLFCVFHRMHMISTVCSCWLLITSHNHNCYFQFCLQSITNCTMQSSKQSKNDTIQNLRAEITALCNDLGIHQPQIKHSECDKELLQQTRDELLSQWNDIQQQLDGLLMDLELGNPQNDKPLSNDDSKTVSMLVEIKSTDIFNWTLDGKSYRLLNDAERERIKKKAQLKHQKQLEELKRFKQQRKKQLMCELNQTDIPSVQILK
eukprot:968106_1